MNPLAGKPLRYAIGADAAMGVLDGADNVVTEVGYDCDVLPLRGIGIAYCNLFDEHNTGDFGPYLHTSDTANQYDEGQIDPDGPGWAANLRQQFTRRRSQGFQYVELDNPDAYSVEVVLDAITFAGTFGLKVVAKNPGLMEGDKARIAAHPNVYGIIVEKGAGDPGEMVALRNRALKPDMPVWFVFFGDAKTRAETIAEMVVINKYRGIGVTFDRHPQEYGGDIIDLALPVVASPAISPTPAQRPSMAQPPASTRIWRGDGARHVAKSLLMLYDQVDSMLPSSRRDGNDGTIGDPSHQARASDHNANDDGIVTALDITHDPASGFDADAFAESLRRVKDNRIEYIIWRGRICSAKVSPWQWRERNQGPGDHSEHVHISVENDIDNPRPWVFDLVNADSPTHSVATRPKIKFGDRGPAVVELQQLLGIDADSFFGSDTDAAVRAFQASRGLLVDGIVGSHTWGLLTEAGGVMPTQGSGLSPDTISRITSAALSSEIAFYSWNDRGRAPIGYIKGMAVMFAYVYAKWKAGDSSARVMAALPTGDIENDALARYGITNITAGPSTLRALFALLIGLGMRESSGKYWEGLDTNAGFKSADETEAGLFQQSWNSRSASPELPKLFASWSAVSSDGFLSIFREGVPQGSSPNLGGGQGEDFQRLCKAKPAFAVECAAIAARVVGGSTGHFGPIRRREVEVRPEAEALLQQVQAIIDAQVVRPEPIVIPSQPTGQPMPSDAPTKFNPAVEDAIAKIRPILEEALAVAQSNGPNEEQALDEIIRRLGGTPPKRNPTVLLPAPSSTTGGTTGGTAAQTSTVTTPPASGGSLTGLAGGSVISGIIAALMGGAEPIIGTPFGMGTEPTTMGTISTIVGGLAPLLGYAGVGGGALNLISAIGPGISAMMAAMRARKGAA